MLKLISALTIALRLYISILTLLKIQEKRWLSLSKHNGRQIDRAWNLMKNISFSTFVESNLPLNIFDVQPKYLSTG
jgi:hypothetical protein